MVGQFILPPQVKRCLIISNTGTYELLHELPNDLRLRILRNQEISKKSQNFIELLSSAQNFASTSKNPPKNRNWTSPAVRPPHENHSRRKHPANDYPRKQPPAPDSPQTPLKFACLTIFATSRPLTQFYPKIKVTNLQKSTNICHT